MHSKAECADRSQSQPLYSRLLSALVIHPELSSVWPGQLAESSAVSDHAAPCFTGADQGATFTLLEGYPAQRFQRLLLKRSMLR